MPQQPGGSGEFFDIVFHGREERNIEYKGPMRWDERETKALVTKASLAMSNIGDGGWIALGVSEVQKGVYEPVGLTAEQAQSFNQDAVQAHVNSFADPPIDLTVRRVDRDGKPFVVIRVRQFDGSPVVCKKNGPEGLKQGTIYTRSRRMNESSAVQNETEMREILDLAVDGHMHDLLARMAKWGVLPAAVPAEDQDAAAFRSERRDLENE